MLNFTNFMTGLLGGFGKVVVALLVLLVAYIAASIAKSLIIKLLTHTKLGFIVSRADGPRPGVTITYISKLVYFLVFMLFIPQIFGALGIDSISGPIMGLLNTVWGYVPSILAAVIVIFVGNIIATTVRALLAPLFAQLKLDELQAKAGMEVKDNAKLSYTLAYIVYVLIMIPVFIVALNVLKIDAITAPAVNMLSVVIEYIPRIVIACLVVFVGYLIGRFAGQIVTQLLASTGVDKKLTDATEGKTEKFVLSKVTGTVVQVVINIIFIAQGFAVVDLKVLTDIGSAIIGYMPKVLAAVIVLTLTYFAAILAEKALKKNGMDGYAMVSKVVIFVVGIIMVLNQLGIATTIVNSAFIIIIAALAVAFAISFGIGGKAFAAKQLDKFDKYIDENKKNK
ncbi:mechanosensitive ion channel [Butyrivibrio sp. AC2005]|uniref:mechanosensitive ion channel n=1 Tax=Butyrivibrio sp. AC2005 TaxID=1280672 RepID=UPI000428B8AC|nr:mechanosensitive ion channel [Butyrivibrio sp. AC2005]